MKKFTSVIFFCLPIAVYAQSSGFSLLQIAPLMTFLLAAITGILNLYIMNKLGRTKEEILSIVRAEFKAEIHTLEQKMASKEQLASTKTELLLTLKNIELKIDYSAKQQDRNEKHN